MLNKTPKLRDLVKGVRSFYVIGNIAVVSPRTEVDKEKLAKAIMSISPKVKAVYIKKRVSGEFRLNELELIGGDNITETIFKENNLRFFVDITKVYVNPSLGSERLNIRNEISKNEIVLDAFTAYGGIALNASIIADYVVAGDLNIDGLYMLRKSIELNKKYVKLIDIIQYDAMYLPFRDKSFDKVYGDNPTMIRNFIQELCRVTKQTLIIYILDAKNNLTNINSARWVKINEYSKNLFIFKGYIRCNNSN
ncbi:methyltransferase [Acidianus sulfidivorans JP7]|uniref:Methyltransferase n=1 Tax=Acidianus sulfidivorans JP7 TaxID=619593 RepID=A0A2U9IKI6_9CREN|nr:methyltransferase [Acidianus sulfidivorans]AWR96549.1 methyltransferase [Acidianus sulfidivorans JP7]